MRVSVRLIDSARLFETLRRRVETATAQSRTAAAADRIRAAIGAAATTGRDHDRALLRGLRVDGSGHDARRLVSMPADALFEREFGTRKNAARPFLFAALRGFSPAPATETNSESR